METIFIGTAKRKSVSVLPVRAAILSCALLSSGVTYAQRFTTLNSASMVPTILNGQRVFTVLSLFVGRSIDRGSIIVYKTALSDGNFLVSRVVGVGGDIMEMKRGILFVNGRIFDDRERLERLRRSDCINSKLIINNSVKVNLNGQSIASKLTVPPNTFYVVSDNRAENFMDSRYLGPIQKQEIVAVVRLPGETQAVKITHSDCIFSQK